MGLELGLILNFNRATLWLRCPAGDSRTPTIPKIASRFRVFALNWIRKDETASGSRQRFAGLLGQQHAGSDGRVRRLVDEDERAGRAVRRYGS